MATLQHDARRVNDLRPSLADRDWWAAQNADWHDPEGLPIYDDLDCSIDYELQAESEVERWFRVRPVDRPGDLDQPWYRYLGATGGYRDCI